MKAEYLLERISELEKLISKTLYCDNSDETATLYNQLWFYQECLSDLEYEE